MKGTKLTILGLIFMLTGAATLWASHIDVTDQYDLEQALNYASGNGIDSLVLTTSGGVYTTHDTLPLMITDPISIVAAPGLAEKPILTNSDPDSNVLEIFRVTDDVYFDGVVFDGGNAQSHGMKYAIRFGNGLNGEASKVGANITVKNCDFVDIFRDKISDPEMEEGHAIYFLRPDNQGDPTIHAGTVRIENCTFTNIGDEAIRMTETEKYDTERCLDSLIVRNCTFTNVDAECVRFYSDTNYDTPDAYVLIEHCTAVNCATRFTYIKNNAGTIVRDIILAHGRLPAPSRADRSDYYMQVQGPGSYIANVDTFELQAAIPHERLSAVEDAITYPETYWGFDPMMADWQNGDYTLPANSHAYYSAHDGTALGDLRWATNTPSVILFDLTSDSSGHVDTDPVLEGRCYDPGTSVTLTAVPDSGYEFTGWTGDNTSTDNPLTVTVNSATRLTAHFQASSGVENRGQVPLTYNLDQNYPNPFNPTTHIKFSLKQDGYTTLNVYNLLGQKVRSLVQGHYNAGTYNITFDGSGLASGVYYYELKSGDFHSVKKLVLMK